MQALNILIVGGSSDLIYLIKKSKFLNKLYITSETDIKNVFNIKFNTFKELAEKCKALQIDIVLVEDEKWILEGIADVLKKSFVNCIAPLSNWTNLALSNKFAKSILNKYSILTPPEIILPNEFPVLVRAEGIIKKANSLTEIVKIKQEIFNYSPQIATTVCIEKLLKGEKCTVTSLYDGKHLLTFPNELIDSKLLKAYSDALEKLLTAEGAEFIGFINSDLIQEDNKIYNTGFSFRLLNLNIISDLDIDFLYLLNSAIYQKLNEIKL